MVALLVYVQVYEQVYGQVYDWILLLLPLHDQIELEVIEKDQHHHLYWVLIPSVLWRSIL